MKLDIFCYHSEKLKIKNKKKKHIEIGSINDVNMMTKTRRNEIIYIKQIVMFHILEKYET